MAVKLHVGWRRFDTFAELSFSPSSPAFFTFSVAVSLDVTKGPERLLSEQIRIGVYSQTSLWLMIRQKKLSNVTCVCHVYLWHVTLHAWHTWVQKFPNLQHVTYVTGISRTFFSENQNGCHTYHVVHMGNKGPKIQAFNISRMSCMSCILRILRMSRMSRMSCMS